MRFSKCNSLSAFESGSSLKHFHLSFKPLQLFICEFSQFFFAELFKEHFSAKNFSFKTVLFLALAKGDLSKPSKANMETDSKSLESKKNNAPLPSAAKVDMYLEAGRLAEPPRHLCTILCKPKKKKGTGVKPSSLF
jgi:hypothetical protein